MKTKSKSLSEGTLSNMMKSSISIRTNIESKKWEQCLMPLGGAKLIITVNHKFNRDKKIKLSNTR